MEETGKTDYLNGLFNLSDTIAGTLEYKAVTSAMRRLGPAGAMALLKTTPLAIAVQVAQELAAPNKLNDVNQVQAINNYRR